MSGKGSTLNRKTSLFVNKKPAIYSTNFSIESKFLRFYQQYKFLRDDGGVSTAATFTNDYHLSFQI